ncbi:MAG TPA: hypothetical protein PK379_05870 [Candidatus Hydrogenedentes bacterium]|nr:hypothetical protein [Candidatus Hydrogenedentota bacterium]HOK89534.1 hypothetical protein [Candidatus Hydrogenedentota bacterium]
MAGSCRGGYLEKGKDRVCYPGLVMAMAWGIIVGASCLAGGDDGKAASRAWPVDQFGAVPDDDQDDRQAFQRAAVTLAQYPGSALELGPGTYRLGAPGDQDPCALTFRNLEGVTIRGRGANLTRLLITSPRHGGVRFFQCRDTRLEGVTIDYDPLPFTQGRVLAVCRASGWYDFAVEPGFPLLSEPWFADAPKPYGQWGMLFERDAPLLKRGVPDHLLLDRWQQVARSVWRVWVAKGAEPVLASMAVGDRFAHLARHGRGGALFFHQCRGGGAFNVTIHASPSLAVCVVGGGPVTMDGLIVTTPPGSRRLVSTDADGVHCQQMETGPRVLNSVFRYMADDAVNIYYYPGRVIDRLSDSVLIVDGANEMRAGDRLVFFDEQEGRVTGEAEAAALEQVPGEGGIPRVRLMLDRTVPNVQARHQGGKGDAVYNMSRCGAGFEIRGNLMSAHRRYGMMLKAPGGVVEDNVLDQLGGCGIVVGNDPFWPEGVIPSAIQITGNLLRDCGRSAPYGASPWGANIQVGTWSMRGPARDRATREITLRNNRALNPMGAAVTLTSVEQVTLEGLAIAQDPKVVPPREAPLIRIENADDVVVSGVRATAPRPEVTALVETTGDCGGVFSVSDLHATLPPGAPLWRDERAARRP